MVKNSKWARGSNQYVKRAGVARPDAGCESTPTLGTRDARRQIEDLGITWTSFDVDRIKQSDVERVRYRFREHLPYLVWNTAALEGNNFTLPEVKTLLDGVTVGGQRLADAQQVLALADAYNHLDDMVGSGDFALTKSVSDVLHGLVARHEAIESGSFRGEGSVTGGGIVRLANGGVVDGAPHGEGGQDLRDHYQRLIDHLGTLDDPRQRALLYFASAVRRQFYFDGNKRTARLMMTGELLSSGFEVVSVPFARKLEFNEALDLLFSQDDATDLLRFLSTCTVD